MHARSFSLKVLDIAGLSTDGLNITIPGNTFFDQLFLQVQAGLTNYTRIYFPTFTYRNPLLSVTVKNSYIQGLQSFHRVGNVLLGLFPLGKSRISFGVGFTEITALFNIDLYPVQFGANLIPKSGTLSATLSNLTSVQTLSFGATTLSLLMEDLELGLAASLIKVDGFGPSGSSGGEAASAFINQNKDQFLHVLSLVLKALFNACASATQSTIASGSIIP